MSESAERSALVVDDDEAFRNRLCRALEARGWEANPAADGTAALNLAAELSPDLAVVDLRLPGMGGLDIVRELHSLDETICIIVLTGYGSIATALAATKLGASHYLSKPADADQILGAYQKIVAGEPEPLEGTICGRAHSGARGVGAHSAGAGRLRRQHLASRQAARPAPAFAAAQTVQVPAAPLRGAKNRRSSVRDSAGAPTNPRDSRWGLHARPMESLLFRPFRGDSLCTPNRAVLYRGAASAAG